MIERILPTSVATSDMLGDDPTAYLLEAEQALVATSVEKRRREFTGGRTCARRALAELGFPEAPILSGAKREPLWPRGVVGSITHCQGYRAAAVARDTEWAALGIDAEPHAPLPDGVLEAVSLPEERTWLDQLSDGHTHWDRLLFSAKESVYKAWFPLTNSWLGFEDALITMDPTAHTFHAHLLISPPNTGSSPPATFTGHHMINAGLVLTAIAHPTP